MKLIMGLWASFGVSVVFVNDIRRAFSPDHSFNGGDINSDANQSFFFVTSKKPSE